MAAEKRILLSGLLSGLIAGVAVKANHAEVGNKLFTNMVGPFCDVTESFPGLLDCWPFYGPLLGLVTIFTIVAVLDIINKSDAAVIGVMMLVIGFSFSFFLLVWAI